MCGLPLHLSCAIRSEGPLDSARSVPAVLEAYGTEGSDWRSWFVSVSRSCPRTSVLGKHYVDRDCRHEQRRWAPDASASAVSGHTDRYSSGSPSRDPSANGPLGQDRSKTFGINERLVAVTSLFFGVFRASLRIAIARDMPSDIAPNSWLGFWERLLVAQSYEWINTRRPVRRHPSRKERHSSQENDRGSKSYGVRWREAVKPTADKPGGSQR
jgi:hypothetical protein